MTRQSGYEDYVSDQDFMTAYLDYQQKYAGTIRESDRVIIERVRSIRDEIDGPDLKVLDLGCSTGNLLKHLGKLVTGVQLVGGELSQDSLRQCRADPELAQMTFEEMNIVDLDAHERFDVIIVNAVLYMMNDDEFDASLKGVFEALRPGGHLVVFDFFHGFPQHLAITETSRSHKTGLTLHFRPITQAEDSLTAAGYVDSEFVPFAIPIDLPMPTAADENAYMDLHSYTVAAADGKRLLFRGTLFQPWCHLFARKPS